MMLRKISLGLMALGSSVSALAAGPATDVPMPIAPAAINVTAPVQQASWSVGLEAAYVQPANDGFQYAQTLDHANSSNGAILKNHVVEPGYDWLGHADLSYHIAGNGRSIQLGFTHLRASNSDSVSAKNGRTVVATPFNNPVFNNTPVGNILSPGSGVTLVKGSSQDDYNDVDLLFGQNIDVGHRVRFNFFGGLRYATLDSSDSTKATRNVVSASTDVVAFHHIGKIKSDFYGLGPRAGIDTHINLSHGFSLVSRIAGSLLVSNVDTKLSVSRTITFDLQQQQPREDNRSITLKDDETRIVPEADARIGIHYNHNFTPAESFGLELGYQVVNYFDVVNKDVVDMVLPNTNISNTDWGYHGPYFRAEINFA